MLSVLQYLHSFQRYSSFCIIGDVISGYSMETNPKMKHRHAVRAEPMKFLIRKFGLRSERVVDGVFELGRTAKTSRTPRKLRYFYIGTQNGKKSRRGIINLSKEEMELFKATKSRFALRFFRFARDADLKTVKIALNCKPDHGLQIGFIFYF